VQQLHALDVTSGVERSGSPVKIQTSVKGPNSDVKFDPLLENPRSALLLADGIVYLTWGSSCDVGSYQLSRLGDCVRCTLARAEGCVQFNTSPASKESGIWASDTGPAADENVVRDYFAPRDQGELNAADNDLGSRGPLLPNQPGPHPHLVLIGGKGSTLYVIDRDHMGKYEPASDAACKPLNSAEVCPPDLCIGIIMFTSSQTTMF